MSDGTTASAPVSRRGLRWIAVLLPVFGIALLVLQAELGRTGETWRLPIDGYDPRDLVRGRYIQFRYRFVEPWRDDQPQIGECLCLSRTNDQGWDPPWHPIECHEVSRCDGWIDVAAVSEAQRYYVPEERASELEVRLQDGGASMVVTIDEGVPTPVELWLDDRPWRDVVGD